MLMRSIVASVALAALLQVVLGLGNDLDEFEAPNDDSSSIGNHDDLDVRNLLQKYSFLQDELDGQSLLSVKRAPFSSWAGKRAPFSAWAGKRAPFSAWAGKRAPFSSWAGKRSDAAESGLRVKRSSDDDHEDDQQQQDLNTIRVRRGAGFSAWGGKRSLSGNTDISRRRFSRSVSPEAAAAASGYSVVYKPAKASFSAWGGKRK